MAYANGRLPDSVLAPIPGNGRLRKDAAAAYNAMASAARVDMRIIEGQVGRTYRSYARQLLAKRIYGSNAAVPGTSNHGWGLATDLMSGYQRSWIDIHGAPFGFAKRWSDAQWEWWHIRWKEGVWKGHSGPVSLRYHMTGDTVKRLQRILRARGFKSVPGPHQNGYGFFGKNTLNAVKRFQRAHHLPSDGVVGPKSWRALTH